MSSPRAFLANLQRSYVRGRLLARRVLGATTLVAVFAYALRGGSTS